jgi:hypothetical protein
MVGMALPIDGTRDSPFKTKNKINETDAADGERWSKAYQKKSPDQCAIYARSLPSSFQFV